MSEQEQTFVQNGGQILTFICDRTFYAFELTTVTDIIEIPEITFVPGLPKFISGLINFRGKALPVVDFRKRLSLPDFDYDSRSCIIVIEIKSNQLGIICERVSDVENVTPDTFSPSPVKNGLIKIFINTPKNRVSLINPNAIIN